MLYIPEEGADSQWIRGCAGQILGMIDPKRILVVAVEGVWVGEGYLWVWFALCAVAA